MAKDDAVAFAFRVSGQLNSVVRAEGFRARAHAAEGRGSLPWRLSLLATILGSFAYCRFERARSTSGQLCEEGEQLRRLGPTAG